MSATAVIGRGEAAVRRRMDEIQRRMDAMTGTAYGSGAYEALGAEWSMLASSLHDVRSQERTSNRPPPPPPRRKRRWWELSERPPAAVLTHVERHRPTSPLRLTIDPAARRVINDEIWERRTSGVETGGGLLGSATPDSVTVTGATVFTSRGTIRTRKSLSFPSRALWELGPGVVGSWHCHPDGYESPSDTDLDTSLQLRDRYGRDRWIEIIAPVGQNSANGWAAPQLAAWAVYRSPLGTPRYERVEV